MFNRPQLSLFSAIALATLAGCGGGQHQQTALPEPNQSEICQTDSWTIAGDCTPGKKIVFVPAAFGNAQLPVLFAAANCDLRYSVVLTNGAVTCIFNPLKESVSSPDSSSQRQGK